MAPTGSAQNVEGSDKNVRLFSGTNFYVIDYIINASWHETRI